MATIRVMYNKLIKNKQLVPNIFPGYLMKDEVTDAISVDATSEIFHPGVTSVMHQAEVNGFAEFESDDASTINYYKTFIDAFAEYGYEVVVSEPTDTPAVVDGQVYDNYVEAVTAASSGGTVTLTADAHSDGVPVQEGSNLVMNLGGYELNIDGAGTGSPGTKTNGFQFLKDSTILIKDGVIKFDDEKKIGIQNYADLTLDNVVIIGGAKTQYLLSNNFGNITIKNNCKFICDHPTIAFDAYYGMFADYDAGVHVTVTDNTVDLGGHPIEFGKAARASVESFKANTSVTVPSDMEVTVASPNCKWIDNGNGTKTLVSTL